MSTVCILTAGLGTRLGEYTKYLNKSLLTINKKAAISHIIDNFNKNTNFIIVVGYKKEIVKSYINLNHKKNKIKFVEVHDFKSKYSGPVKSLIQAKYFLQKPFFFVSCDTLWEKKNFKKNINWMSVSKKKLVNTENYCNLKVNKKIVIDIKDKEKTNKHYKQFTGLAYIKDHAKFWAGITKAYFENKTEISNGFKEILAKKIYLEEIKWSDIGSIESYENELKKYEPYNFSKKKEHIYIYKNKVTKFFTSKKKINNLVYKANTNKEIYPKILKKNNFFIQYNFIQGKNLYQNLTPNIFLKLLSFLSEKLWIKKNQSINFKNKCINFYFKKTSNRIKLFFKKYKLEKDIFLNINKNRYLPINEILKKINWKEIYNGELYKIHGDLQFDNIIYNKKKGFKLIDWRDNFSGLKNSGDLYYDLAKLAAGIEINYFLIKKNKFKFSEKKNFFKYKHPSVKKKYFLMFEEFLTKKNFNIKKIQIIKSLIFLNMSPLHTYPFDKLLFCHGKVCLTKYLSKNI